MGEAPTPSSRSRSLPEVKQAMFEASHTTSDGRDDERHRRRTGKLMGAEWGIATMARKPPSAGHHRLHRGRQCRKVPGAALLKPRTSDHPETFAQPL